MPDVEGVVAVDDEVADAGRSDCAHAPRAQAATTTDSSLAVVFMESLVQRLVWPRWACGQENARAPRDVPA